MNPSIFVSVAKEPELSTSERETIRYDHFVARLLKYLPEPLSACHIGLGLAGELGELYEVNCDEMEEYGDYEFYLQAFCTHYNLTLAELPLEYIEQVDSDGFVYWTGQLIDCIKREYIYNEPRDIDRIKQCLSIIVVYLLAEYNDMGTSRAEVLQTNAIKLGQRYAGLYYSDEAAQARADKT